MNEANLVDVLKVISIPVIKVLIISIFLYLLRVLLKYYNIADVYVDIAQPISCAILVCYFLKKNKKNT